jgi:hypothetical protein
MYINNVVLPTELTARLTEFRKSFDAAQRMMAEVSLKYPLPTVLLKAN